jgi:DMSO/TMAO reductase YedYZ molybdopterin-dependent catalytic subunit
MVGRRERAGQAASDLAGRFESPVRTERTAAILGLALAVSFTVCFLTGVWSHLQQVPPSWYHPVPRPAGLYRFTQGLHVATGLASIPLLLVKLWTVYPRLYEWPPVRSVAHGLERLMMLFLVGGSLFLLLSGVNNINLVYPYEFSFRRGHYAAAWIVMGALLVHVAAKIRVSRRALARRQPATAPPVDAGGLSRRGLIAAAFGSAALVTMFTIGQTYAPLRRLALLAPRRPDVGPQGFPVNRTAASVDLEHVDLEVYRLTVGGPGVPAPLELTYDDLRALPQHEATLPIACVEGWSASRRWRGVRVRDLLDAAGVVEPVEVQVVSLQEKPLYRRSRLDPSVVADPDTLLALEVEGEVLHADHGFPCRLIAPNRPGVMQTKWVTRIEVA